jgi:hypothetical protein
MRTPWWLSSLLVVLAALPVQAQEEDENELPSTPALTEPDEPPASPPPAVIESETTAPAAPAAEVTARPALGVRFFRGTQVRIAEVLDDSPADLAGLHLGDLVVSFNGTLPATTDEFIALVASAPIDATSEIVVVRGSERHSIVIEPDAWATVFTEPYVAARYDLDDDGDPDTPAPVPSPPYYHAPYYWYTPYYYVSNVSPVVVPASWYVPYPYPYPYYYTAYWGYYPAWYYNAYVPGYYWPYYWNYPAQWGVAPHPHHHHHHDHHPEAPDQDSAGLDSGSTLTVRFDQP